MSQNGQGQYSIGSNHWPGLSKLIEEAGEVQQVCGKLLGTGGKPEHWDGSNLIRRLEEELADLAAAIIFVTTENGLSESFIAERAQQKFELFNAWHKGTGT